MSALVLSLVLMSIDWNVTESDDLSSLGCRSVRIIANVIRSVVIILE